ncbi:MAG: hypothetical protein NVSMB19_19530 [Vulcanimicrobiaceae bacterium]
MATLGSGAALANSNHGMGSTMSGHHASIAHPMYQKNHMFGNDKARCRDAKGRFLKRSNGRCLAK